MELSKTKEIKVGAGAVIIRDGKTFLAKRRGSFHAGMWGSFGGYVEFGENPTETVVREAKEELGIELKNIQFASCANFIIGHLHYIDISFVAELKSGDPVIMEPERIEEIGWFSLDNLPTPLFEPVEVVLTSLREGKYYFEINK